jgi:hypothetical protein
MWMQKTGLEKLGDVIKQVGEGLVKSGPGNWINQGPAAPRPQEN